MMMICMSFWHNWKDEFDGYPGITYENGREHLLYRIESDAFYAIVLKETGKVIGNIHFQKDENGLPKWKDTFVYAVLNNRR